MDDPVVKGEAVGENLADETESPGGEPAEAEMSAAEALAQVTAAAEAPPAEAAEPAEAVPETAPEEAMAEEAPAAEAQSAAADAEADETHRAEAEPDTAPEKATADGAPAAGSTAADAEPDEARPADAEPETAPAQAAVDEAPEANDADDDNGPAETAPEDTAGQESADKASAEEIATEATGAEAETAPEDAAAQEPADKASAEEIATQATGAGAETEVSGPEAAASETAAEGKVGAAKEAKPKLAESAPPPPPDRPEMRAVREAMENRQPIEGRVIGWNEGGFHLALGELSAFCPRSEMEIGEVEQPESYLDRTFPFRVLRIQGKRQRIVVSRAAHLRNEKSRQRNKLRKKLKPGTVLDGTVASLKEFGAFVDLGGAQGLVHVSEISHRRVEHPGDVLSEGQQVQVKVLKVEQGGRRISLSIRALEPDPWKELVDRFPRGAVVKGTVEKANQFGAFIELAPGLTGLLPTRSMSIPRETTPARAYPPGKKVSVQIVSIDPRRQRISLALEGSGLEGSRADYQEYQRQRREAEKGEGFNALASAFRRLESDAD